MIKPQRASTTPDHRREGACSTERSDTHRRIHLWTQYSARDTPASVDEPPPDTMAKNLDQPSFLMLNAFLHGTMCSVHHKTTSAMQAGERHQGGCAQCNFKHTVYTATALGSSRANGTQEAPFLVSASLCVQADSSGLAIEAL